MINEAMMVMMTNIVSDYVWIRQTSHIYTKLISILILSIPFGIYNIEFLNYKQCERKMKNVVQPKLKDLS